MQDELLADRPDDADDPRRDERGAEVADRQLVGDPVRDLEDDGGHEPARDEPEDEPEPERRDAYREVEEMPDDRVDQPEHHGHDERAAEVWDLEAWQEPRRQPNRDRPYDPHEQQVHALKLTTTGALATGAVALMRGASIRSFPGVRCGAWYGGRMNKLRSSPGVQRAVRFLAAVGAVQCALGCGSSGGVTASTSTDGSGSTSKDGGGLESKDGGGSLGTSDGSPGHDGQATSGDAAGDGSFCNGTGPVVQLPGMQGSYTECTSQIASTLFENALCTCDDVHVAGYLETTAFNSLGGADAGGVPLGAAVGVNNAYSISAGYTQIGGSFSIAGSSSVAFIGYVETHGDLRLAGAASIPGYTKVHRDACSGRTSPTSVPPT